MDKEFEKQLKKYKIPLTKHYNKYIGEFHGRYHSISFTEVRYWLNQFLTENKIKDDSANIAFDIRHDFGGEYSQCEISTEIRLQGHILKTQEDLEQDLKSAKIQAEKDKVAAKKRIEKKKARLIKKEKEERELYETLKKKFG
jgi:hypothetical protein